MQWSCLQNFRCLPTDLYRVTNVKYVSSIPYTRAVPEVQGDEFLKFWEEKCVGFLVASFLPFSPRENAQRTLRTKNAIAMESVVFCYRGSILPSVPIRCHCPQEEQHPSCYRGSELLSVANCYRRSDLLPVVFLVSQGPLGRPKICHRKLHHVLRHKKDIRRQKLTLGGSSPKRSYPPPPRFDYVMKIRKNYCHVVVSLVLINSKAYCNLTVI